MINTAVSPDLGREKKNEVLKKIHDEYGLKEEKSREPVKKLGKDDFFKLMVTQLKNQDPLKPYDNEQMAAQMAQFTSLEQMFNMNANLEKLSDSQKPLHHLGSAGLIGKWVTSDTSRSSHTEGKYTAFNFELPVDASKVRVTILNEKGETVREIEKKDLKKGPNSFEWDGKKSNNTLATSGSYMIQVRAENSRGQNMPVTTTKKMQVSGVSFDGKETVLLVGDPKAPQKILLRTVSQIENGSDAGTGGSAPPAPERMVTDAVSDPSQKFMAVNPAQFGMGSVPPQALEEKLNTAMQNNAPQDSGVLPTDQDLKAANPIAAQIVAKLGLGGQE